MTELPAPECRSGYTRQQVDQILEVRGRSRAEFDAWMRGQTIALCEGQRWDYETESYVEACGGVAHGAVIYPWDLERFLNRQPILDW